MSSDKSSFDDDIFEDDDDLDPSLDDDEEPDLDFDLEAPITKRRMIEDLLEERRLQKQISAEYDFDFSDED